MHNAGRRSHSERTWARSAHLWWVFLLPVSCCAAGEDGADGNLGWNVACSTAGVAATSATPIAWFGGVSDKAWGYKTLQLHTYAPMANFHISEANLASGSLEMALDMRKDYFVGEA